MTTQNAAVVDDLAEQADDLCHFHAHVTRIIANFHEEPFSSRGERTKSRCRSTAADRGHLNGGGPGGR